MMTRILGLIAGTLNRVILIQRKTYLGFHSEGPSKKKIALIMALTVKILFPVRSAK